MQCSEGGQDWQPCKNEKTLILDKSADVLFRMLMEVGKETPDIFTAANVILRFLQNLKRANVSIQRLLKLASVEHFYHR